MKKQPEDRLPKTFWWANFTQFGGAMNDNLFKLFMIYALIDWKGEDARAEVLASVGVAFAVPFLLFVPIAGSFADHFSKRWVIVVLKAVEIAVMSFGVLALSLHSEAMLYVTIFLMSTQSAFFGPCKYGIIPEQVGTARLSRANGMIQMFTYLAILSGTVVAPELSERFGEYYHKAALICIVVAVIGFVFSLKIGPSPSHRRRPINLNGFVNLVRTTKLIRRDGFLTLAVLAGSFFMLIGAFMQLNILDYGAEHLGMADEQSTRLFLLTAIGIGIGSVVAGWVSGRLIEFGIVPVGTVIMFVCLLVIGTVPEGSVQAVRVSMFFMGIGAGFYVVPLESFIQYRSPKDKVGSVKATNGFLSWIGVILASGLLYLNSSVLELTAQQGFLVVSVLLFALTVFSFWILPDFFIKFVVMCIVRTFYRLRVYGIENLPTDRAALLVCNHVSLVDALLVVSSQQRRIRTLMSRRVYNQSNLLVRKIVDLAGVILIQESDGPKKLVLSLKTARKALDAGFLVCIFAEGGLTLSGMMRPFKPGFERIIKGSKHPIIPIYIGGAWGSYTSWKHGIPRLNSFRDFRHPVSVHFGRELPSTATVPEVQQAVCVVSTETFELLKNNRTSMAEEFIRVARRNWNRIAIIEKQNNALTYGQLLIRAQQAGERILEQIDPAENCIGIQTRNGAENVILQLALSMNRLVSVPLEHMDSEQTTVGKIKQTGLETVIAEDDFSHNPTLLKKLAIQDILGDRSANPGLLKLLKMKFLPVSSLCNTRDFKPDEIATIQFTRGNTGEPKAVLLSHHNILSNIEALKEVVNPEESDTLLGTVPLSNIYGYTITVWLPLLSGIRAVYCNEPFNLKETAELSATYQVSILPTTPEFIKSCNEHLDTSQLQNLRYVFTGGASLSIEDAEQFENKFGIRPLEGYGATELSPVCSLSLPDIKVSRYSEIGMRENSAGRLLQGIAVKIVDPVTNEPLAAGEEGMILAKGPNVMIGYLDNEKQNKKVIKNGWYSTGDAGYLDADGFLSIVGRIKQ